MNMQKIFSDSNSLKQYLDHARAQAKISSGINKIGTSGRRIGKWKMTSESDMLVVIPKFLYVPYDVTTGEHLPTPVPMMGTVRTAISIVKIMANQSASSSNSLREWLGDAAFSVLNLETDVVTDAEYAVFKPYVDQVIYATTVMGVKPVDSNKPYATLYRVDVDIDPETDKPIKTKDTPLIVSMWECEEHCIAIRNKQLHEKNEKRGDARRPDKEIAAECKSNWENRIFTNPYNLGLARALFIPSTSNFEPTADAVNGWSPDRSSISKFEMYFKENRFIKDAIAVGIGSKYDRYEDYYVMKWHVPKFTEDDRMVAAQSIQRSSASIEDEFQSKFKDFDKAYTEFRNDTDYWDPKVIIKSAYEFHKISDDAARTIFKNALPQLSEALRTPEVRQLYGTLIESVDEEISNQLLEEAMTGDVDEVGDYTKELSEAIHVDEDADGFGGDSLEAGITDDILAGLGDLEDAISG